MDKYLFKYDREDRVIILDNREGNRFEIGEEVIIVNRRLIYQGEPFYRCINSEGKSWDVMENSMKLIRPKVILPDSLFEVE